MWFILGVIVGGIAVVWVIVKCISAWADMFRL